MKKLITLGFLSLGIVFLAGCGQQQNTNQQAAQLQEIVYTNSEYGFTLNLPLTWGDYTTQLGPKADGVAGTSDSVAFSLPDQTPLFVIKIYPETVWDDIQQAEGPTPIYLGENSKYVFGYSTAQDAANETMVSRISEIKDIMKTFVVTTVENPAAVTTTTTQKSLTFDSEHKDFSYTLNWNTKLLTLSDVQYEWASENAPSFDIVGGGKITVATGWIDSPGYKMASFINDIYYAGDKVWPATSPEPSETGTSNPVYYFSRSPQENSGCFVKYGVVKGLNEALAIRMEDCNGNDMLSSQAFGDLLNDLKIVRIEKVSN